MIAIIVVGAVLCVAGVAAYTRWRIRQQASGSLTTIKVAPATPIEGKPVLEINVKEGASSGVELVNASPQLRTPPRDLSNNASNTNNTSPRQVVVVHGSVE